MLALATIAVTMIAVDVGAVTGVQHIPHWLIAFFDEATDFGKSGWLLAPTALLLAAMAALASPALPPMSQRVLAAVAVRLGFLHLAVALPGLLFTDHRSA